LNDSGENLITRIFDGGAVHVSFWESTHAHAHYAWKIHIGLDAPVWFRSAFGSVEETDRVRAVVIPPGLHHEVGAMGWTCTVFTTPGSRGTPWHASDRYWVPDKGTTARLVELGLRLPNEARLDTTSLVDAIFETAFDGFPRPTVDPRVKRVLNQLKTGSSLAELAVSQRLSLDRLSHLVKQETGMALRKRLVWSRLTSLLSQGERHATIAAAAASAGFADHAHLTRTYRTYLGRLPSDFSGPPDVLCAW
jgi:AraC-like DNA-binding protein